MTRQRRAARAGARRALTWLPAAPPQVLAPVRPLQWATPLPRLCPPAPPLLPFPLHRPLSQQRGARARKGNEYIYSI